MEYQPGDTFDPFVSVVPHSFPLQSMRELQRRARSFVRKRTVLELREAQSDIAFFLSEYFYIQKQRWIERQLEEGSYVTGFLPYEDRTESGLKYLIENCYDPDVTQYFDYPKEEEMPELYALEESIVNYDLDDDRFPGATVEEYVAVLALQQVANAIHTFYWDEDDDQFHAVREDMHEIRLTGLAGDAVTITETVCRAESLRELRFAEESFQQRLLKLVPQQAAEMAKQKISLSAKKAAAKRHFTNNQHKAQAIAEWLERGEQYSSMRAFARVRFKEYGQTDYLTVYNWLRAAKKSS